jgi:hypothetical protein
MARMAFSCSAAFFLEGSGPSGDRFEGAHGGEYVHLRGVVRGSQLQRGRDDRAGGQAAEAGPDLLGRGHDERVELALAVNGGVDRGAAGGEQDLQCCSLGPGAGLSQVGASQGIAGRAHGVDGVGFSACSSSGAGGPVELDHQLTAFDEMNGQPGAVAADPSMAHARSAPC